MSKRGFCLEVSGEFACFTRPELKIERISYDILTPSAARAIFEAIFWKPAISWMIRRIEVMEPIRWISIRRNEVGAIASERVNELFVEENRQQRAGLFLRDVRYRIHAEFKYIPPEQRKLCNCRVVPEFLMQADFEEYADYQKLLQEEPRKDESEAKYAAMFQRRAKKGQWFHAPYLGTREFAANVKYLADPSKESDKPIDEDRDFSWMLYDMDYSDPQNIRPLFYRAEMKQGVIEVPDRNDSEKVRG